MLNFSSHFFKKSNFDRQMSTFFGVKSMEKVSKQHVNKIMEDFYSNLIRYCYQVQFFLLGILMPYASTFNASTQAKLKKDYIKDFTASYLKAIYVSQVTC